MTQASSTKTDTKPTTPAPATTGAKPADKPPGANGTTPAPAGAAVTTGTAAGGSTEAAPAAKKGSSRIFIATGNVYEFETTAKAEKFLNGGGETSPPTEYAVLRGKRIGTSKKVSLR